MGATGGYLHPLAVKRILGRRWPVGDVALWALSQGVVTVEVVEAHLAAQCAAGEVATGGTMAVQIG